MASAARKEHVFAWNPGEFKEPQQQGNDKKKEGLVPI